MQWLHGALLIVFACSLFGSVFYSVRYRRQQARKARGIDAAKMNMSMGAMLVSISLIQLFLFEGSSVRVIVGLVMLLLGLFNLFAGIRNYGLYNRIKE
ncbi:YtpI family protein [Paenibacillus hodogayensis]|uniref:YtpI family protein n=1 Tax=Paenibacillus hodogayensis TaxID=279208 RepID=A0ABV5VW67_9BACL